MHWFPRDSTLIWKFLGLKVKKKQSRATQRSEYKYDSTLY